MQARSCMLLLSKSSRWCNMHDSYSHRSEMGELGTNKKQHFWILPIFFHEKKLGRGFILDVLHRSNKKQMREVSTILECSPQKKNTHDIFLFILVGEETCNLSDSFCFLSILDDPGRMPPKHWQNHDYDNRKLLYIWDLPPPSRIPTANKGLYLLYTQLKM